MAIQTISGGCPVCGGDVKGDDDHLYHCGKCNLLFARHSLKNNQNR